MNHCKKCGYIGVAAEFAKPWRCKPCNRRLALEAYHRRKKQGESETSWQAPSMDVLESLACIRLRKWAHDCANRAANLAPLIGGRYDQAA